MIMIAVPFYIPGLISICHWYLHSRQFISTGRFFWALLYLSFLFQKDQHFLERPSCNTTTSLRLGILVQSMREWVSEWTILFEKNKRTITFLIYQYTRTIQTSFFHWMQKPNLLQPQLKHFVYFSSFATVLRYTYPKNNSRNVCIWLTRGAEVDEKEIFS